MKWGVTLVAIIIAGSFYYFWSASRVTMPLKPRPTTEVQVETRPQVQEKYIPPNAVMEDGTI